MEKKSTVYEIRVQGHVDPHRFRWFEELQVTQTPDGATVLVGPMRDQAALHGLMHWLHDIGVVLISVRRLEDADEMEKSDEA